MWATKRRGNAEDITQESSIFNVAVNRPVLRLKVSAGSPALGPSPLASFGARLSLTDQIADQRPDPLGGERFFHEVVGDVFDELSRFGSDGPAGHEYEALDLLGEGAGKGGVDVHPIGAWHHQVAQNRVVAMARKKQFERLLAVCQARDVVLFFEDSAEQCADHGVVVDDQYATADAAGWRGCRRLEA